MFLYEERFKQIEPLKAMILLSTELFKALLCNSAATFLIFSVYSVCPLILSLNNRKLHQIVAKSFFI